IRNVVPRPTPVSTVTEPPLCSTMPYTVLSPSPVPLPGSFVVKNGSKRCACVATSIPVPLSVTSRRMCEPSLGRMPGGVGASPARTVAGIDGKVHDDLLDLAGIGLDAAEAGLGQGDEIDGLADQALEHGLHARDDVVEIEDLGRQHLLAAEGEELAGESGCLIRRVPDALGVLAQGMPGRKAAEDEITVAAHDHEQVVEVVCDTARELAHRVHLLRLPKLVFALPERLIGALELG